MRPGVMTEREKQRARAYQMATQRAFRAVAKKHPREFKAILLAEVQRVKDEGYYPAPFPLRPCGTAAAYHRHIRRGEPVDDACRRAMREYMRGRKKA